MCFRCLIFSLSGPFELSFFALFYCLLDLRSGECNVVSPYVLCSAPPMDLFALCVACLTVFVNCFVKQFAICLGVFAILLSKVTELCVAGGAPLDRPCMVPIECVCCARERLDAPSICFVCVFVCRKYSSFRSLRAGSHVFAFLCEVIEGC